MASRLTAVEVAERWGVSPKTVRKLCARGQLRALRIGDTWRIAPGDVEAFEQAHTTGATTAPAPTQPDRPARQGPTRTVSMGGQYDAVVRGPVPWRSEVVP